MLNQMGWLLSGRFVALVLKEVRQILRNRQLIVLLLVPPTLQLIVFGLALSPDVNQISLGVLDQSRTPASREFVAALVTNNLFTVQAAPPDQATLTQAVRTGQVSVGLVIPVEFAGQLAQNQPAAVQVFIDAIDANTAGIAQSYIMQIARQFGPRWQGERPVQLLEPQIVFLYNPGLIASWFFVPGVMGIVLTLTGSLVTAVTSIREKDTGTLEQLLMTPAAGWEIVLAKVVPIFTLLVGDFLLASVIARFVFGLPFRGNYFLLLGLSGLYIFVCIGLGLLLATLCRTQQQVILASFFFNVPIIQLSGAIAPTESMPAFFRLLSNLDPLRHYVAIARSLLLKGVGLEAILPHAVALVAFAVALLTVSVVRFRAQLN